MKINKHSILIATLAVLSTALLANRGGSPGGRTGSETDQQKTCSTNGGCHGGSDLTQQDMISANVPTSGYVDGSAYTVTLTVTRNNRNTFGYEIMAEDKNGNAVGSFTSNGDGNANESRITHKFASSTGSGSRTWNLDWTAPANGTGEVTFYAVALAANGNNATGGDQAFNDTLKVNEGSSASIANLNMLNLRVFPNPTSNYIKIDKPLSLQVDVKIFNLLGKEFYAHLQDSEINVAALPRGRYFIQLLDEERFYNGSFIKN